MKKPSRILSDHSRKGKKFVPPLVSGIGQKLEYVRWIDSILPEILWIGLLIHHYGLREANDLSISLAKITIGVVKPEKSKSFSRISEFKAVSLEQAIEIKRKLGEIRASRLLNALWGLVALYEGCPLSVFFDAAWKSKHPISQKDFTYALRNCIELLLDRTSKEGAFLQTTAFYIDAVTGKLKFSTAIDVPDPEDILQYPHTEKSLRLASFVRSHITAYGILEFDPTWSKYFWNKSLEISDCE